MEPIIIPISKRKITLLFFGSVLFVIAGIYFLMEPGKFVSPVMQNKPFIFIVGVAAVIFFGICAVFSFIKFFDKRPGLIIDEKGITDNSSGVSGGLISWKEIIGFSTAQVQNQRFILIMVNDPEKRIEAETGSFKKRMMKLNYRMYKTPVCLTPNGLQCNFDELYQLISDSYAKHRNSPMADSSLRSE